MADVQQPLLALPPPRAAAANGLRASLHGAAAIPVDPVQAVRPGPDAAFGSTVRPLHGDKTSASQADGGELPPPLRLNAALDWVEARFFGGQSGPFLAQQLGQGVRLVAPTLEANAEVAAYTAAQQRADGAAQGTEGRLDLQA